jgi:exosortase A-associated hydrolase 2
MPPPPLDAFFQPAPDGGQRLYLHHTPPEGIPLKGALLYVHPWAEEMNKSRRMAALASRALATEGWAVLQLDLLGCGDSSGDFGDASWLAWLDDVTRAAHWLQARHPGAPLWLWGLRAGALLVTAAAPRIAEPLNLLFWQPAQQGKALLQQFLRLKAAAQLADSGGKAMLEAARADLVAGRAVQVAGYSLPPALAQGLEAATLNPPANPAADTPGRLVWLEVSAQAEPVLAPAALAAWPRWQAAGWQVAGCAVHGPAFWQTTEIEDAPALLAATAAALNAGVAPIARADAAAPEAHAA